MHWDGSCWGQFPLAMLLPAPAFVLPPPSQCCATLAAVAPTPLVAFVSSIAAIVHLASTALKSSHLCIAFKITLIMPVTDWTLLMTPTEHLISSAVFPHRSID